MKRLFLAALPMALVACAATPDTESAEPRDAKAYRTGSNIPMRDEDIGPAVKTIRSGPQPASRGAGG